MKPWMEYLIVFVLFCHGFVYVRIGAMLPAPVKGWNGRSWLLGEWIANSQLTRVSVWLHVIAGIVLLACAVAIGLPSLFAGWWRPLAVAGALLGIVAFAVFWDGQTGLLVDEGGLGALISLLVLIGAVAFPNAFDR
jgi:hypothetical protein